MYEGCWKKDLKHGFGKEFYPNGNIKYIGGFHKGSRSNFGVSFYLNYNKWYEGIWKDGKQHGKGMKYYEDGQLEMEGVYISAFGRYKFKGKCYECKRGKLIYEGEMLGNKRHGEGNSYNEQNGLIKYAGNFINDFYSGFGKLYYPCGIMKYEGLFKNGNIDFLGEMSELNGNKDISREMSDLNGNLILREVNLILQEPYEDSTLDESEELLPLSSKIDDYLKRNK